MTFSPKKDKSFGIFLLIVGLFILTISILLPITSSKNITYFAYSSIFLLDFLFISLLIWLWLGTYYEINERELKVVFGPIRWRVPINEIDYIRLNQSSIGGMIKLTLSFKSIEIKYRKRSSIFISPEPQDEFIAEFKRLSERIEIKNK